MVKGIYADENLTAEIAEVAYFLGSHAEESESLTSDVMEVETVNDDGRRWRGEGGGGMARRMGLLLRLSRR